MKHNYTDEQLQAAALSRLRPISEAGPVPEGCVRVSGYIDKNEWFIGIICGDEYDTHFADIRLPEPADKHPEPLVTKPISLPPTEGISLRDWFAGMALQGKATRLSNPHEHRDILSSDCYDVADAMLAAREVKP